MTSRTLGVMDLDTQRILLNLELRGSQWALLAGGTYHQTRREASPSDPVFHSEFVKFNVQRKLCKSAYPSDGKDIGMAREIQPQNLIATYGPI